MENFRSQTLTCWCCWERFKTRAEYVDQDQDNGFGICKSCQEAENQRNDREYQKIFDLVYNGMKPENRAKVDADIKKHWPERRNVIVNWALDKWLVSFGFTKN